MGPIGYAYTEKEIYYQELAHVIIEADKSQDLQSASWKPTRTNGIIQSEFESLGRRRVNHVNTSPTLSPKTGED